jgi:cell filamentation protein, protein adenylyltransferase
VNPERYQATMFGEVRRTIGRYGHFAYYAKPIPRAVDITMPSVALLADAEAALGRLAGAGRLLPNPHFVARPYLLREAVASARIEGTQTDVEEVLDVVASDEAPNADVEEVVNYVRALDAGIDMAARLPLGIRVTRAMHEILLAGVRGRERQPGELRRSQNWIGTPGATLETAIFVPPPPEELGGLLADWERFANREDSLPILVCAALLHYQFETLHPFLDGNGRLGRLLIIFYLITRGRLPAPLLYLSPYLEVRRDEYFACLQGVRERGDFDTWLRFFLRGVEMQANDAVARAERLLDMRERYRAATARLRSQAANLVDLVFETPVLTARLIEARASVARPTALRLLGQLAELGILAESSPVGARRQRRWIAREVLDAQTKPI